VAPLLYFISQNSNTPLIVYAALFSLIYYAWQPAQNYLIAKYTRKASHGMGFGVNFFLIFGLGSIATSSGGYVTDNYGVDVFYWIMSFVAAAGLLAALMVYFPPSIVVKGSLPFREKLAEAIRVFICKDVETEAVAHGQAAAAYRANVAVSAGLAALPVTAGRLTIVYMADFLFKGVTNI